MIKINDFLMDNRFNINVEDAKRIFKRKVKKYEIVKLKLSKIKKYTNGKIMDLEDTTSYRLLNGEITNNDYNLYCKNYTEPYEGHSLNSFNKLVEQFNNYNIKNGAIIIDQFGFIRDGQHRASILLLKYGKEYEIEVVKIYYSGLRLKSRFNIIKRWLNKK